MGERAPPSGQERCVTEMENSEKELEEVERDPAGQEPSEETNEKLRSKG